MVLLQIHAYKENFYIIFEKMQQYRIRKWNGLPVNEQKRLQKTQETIGFSKRKKMTEKVKINLKQVKKLSGEEWKTTLK